MTVLKFSNVGLLSFLSVVQVVRSFHPAFLQSPKDLLPSTPSASITSKLNYGTSKPLPMCYHTRRKSNSILQMTQDDDDDDDYDDDDDEFDPLGDGVDSVSWLPPLTADPRSPPPTPPKIKTTSTADSQVLPLFPLGNIVYTPNSEHVLNIFEPRYRQMYNDILMNGTKRFVVSMSHPEREGTFAKVGVVFQLEDLKEVSEQTGDQIKYVCNHKVVGRVLIHRVLNPEVWNTRETYLRVEGIVIDETDSANEVKNVAEMDDDDDDENETEEKKSPKDEAISKAAYAALLAAMSKSRKPTPLHSKKEKRFIESFKALVDKQHKVGEDIRFTLGSVGAIAVAPGGGKDGLWMTVRLWQSFIEQRLVGRQNDMQMEFQKKLIAFLKQEKGLGENELPSAIGFDDLSPSLQQEVKDLQKRMQRELRPLVLESTLTMQKVLECNDHGERVDLLRYFVDAEKKRLDAKSTLQGMFSGSPDAVATDFVEMDERIEGGEGEKKQDNEGKPTSDMPEMINRDADVEGTKGSLLTDEPDAFQ